MVFVTHNIDEALLLGTRVVLMSASPGRIDKEWRINRPWPRDLNEKGLIDLREEMVNRLQACSCAKGAPVVPMMILPGEDEHGL